jgi:TatD DNase family protein
MNKFINFHTHILSKSADCIDIYIQDPRENLKIGDHYYCYGVHPWYSDKVDLINFKINLKQCSMNPNFFGLGEIGLDKINGPEFSIQENVFKQQIAMAIELDIKNITLHCVKSFNECQNELTNQNYKGKLILHDYRSTIEMFNSFSNKFDTYASFGKAFLKTNKAQGLITKMPPNRILLETDDDKETSILEVYDILKNILEVPQKSILDNCAASLKSLLHK